MHCPWTRKTRAWGYEVIRGIDEDDPTRVIRAFKRPTGLAFVDLNSQVENDYGGYAWTQWMPAHFGDTALHIALKWKRHRAVKALMSLRPDWTIPNEAGVTSEQLVLQMYGKSMAKFKDEQEREYEIDDMQGEDEAMRRLLNAEQAARDEVREKFLRELHAARTVGVEREADILFKHGRIILARDAAVFTTSTVRHQGCGVAAAADTSDITAATPAAPAVGSGGGGGGGGGAAWVSHVCRELRRNRFAAQRAVVRRNRVPMFSPARSVAGDGRGTTGRTSTASPSSISPSPTTAKSFRSREGTATIQLRSKDLDSPKSAKSVRFSSGRSQRRGEERNTANSGTSGDGSRRQVPKRQRDDGLLFHSSSAVGSGRWPCAEDANNTGHARREVSPLRSASPPGFESPRGSVSPHKLTSPLEGSTRAHSTRERGGNTAWSPKSDGGRSARSGFLSSAGNGSPSLTRFERSSRMSALRTTKILAAGATSRRLTPESRLKRKMATRSASRARPMRSLAATYASPIALPAAALASPPQSPLFLAPLDLEQANGRSPARGDVSIAASPPVDGRGTALGGETGAVSRDQRSGASALQTRLAAIGGGGVTAATGGDRDANGIKAGTPGGAPGKIDGAAAGVGSRSEDGGKRSPAKDRGSSGVIEGQGDDPSLDADSAVASRPETTKTAAAPPDVAGSGSECTNRKRRSFDGGGGGDTEDEARRPPPPWPRQGACAAKPDPGDQTSPSRPPSQGTQKVGDVLQGVAAGPVRNVLAALLTSTIMTENGRRVLAPTFPSVSALRELKYCGPVDPSEALALQRIVIVRPGVLVRLSLPGKRVGDEGAAALAPALAGIRSVDLRSNNIGDAGAVAIGSALREAVAAATAAGTATTASTTTTITTMNRTPAVLGETATVSKVSKTNGKGGGWTSDLIILKSLSLAGNRMGDAGVGALSELLEDDKGGRESGKGQAEETGRAPTALASAAAAPVRSRSPARPQEWAGFLGWLSVAGNPGISDEAKQRLLRAGSNRRCRWDSHGHDGNNTPAMVIIA